MKNTILSISFLLVVLSLSNTANLRASQVTSEIFNRMPLAFTKNMGQWDERVLFRASAGGATMWFAREGVTYQFIRRIEKNGTDTMATMEPRLLGKDTEPDSVEQLVITTKFVGANPDLEVVGKGLMEYKCNYFFGDDPAKWHADVPNYEAIVLNDIYPGIDLRYSGDGSGQAAYEFVVALGADVSQIKVEYVGVEKASIDAYGRMVVTTKWGDMIAAVNSPTDEVLSGIASFSQLSEKTIGFGAASGSQQALGTLAVRLSYSTYLGGANADFGSGIAVDLAGSAYVMGWTYSSDFPTASPFDGSFNGGNSDAFVTKLDRGYVCGDADGSGTVDIFDAVYLINYVFSGGPAPNPLLSGDADCSGTVNISDAVYLINYIFSGGAAPCAACP